MLFLPIILLAILSHRFVSYNKHAVFIHSICHVTTFEPFSKPLNSPFSRTYALFHKVSHFFATTLFFLTSPRTHLEMTVIIELDCYSLCNKNTLPAK